MRRGEALGLRWRDLDLDAGRLSITQTLIAPDFKVQFSTPKTAKGRRSVALDSRTVAALREHRTRQAYECELFDLPAPELVFMQPDGEPVHPHSLSEAFVRRAKEAKLPRLNLHGLRHTYATLALHAGVHPKIVSERLGHSSVSITLDVYSHAVPTMQESAAELVAALFAADEPPADLQTGLQTEAG
jgi:integrase